MKRPGKQRLLVNKGFTSIYALCLLQVVLLFSLMVIQIAISIAQSHQSTALFETELMSIYRIKARLYQLEEEMKIKEETEQAEALEEKESDEIGSEEPSESGFPEREEILTHQGYVATISYEQEEAYVVIGSLHFKVICDMNTFTILDLVYLS